jgi:uncharacterized cupin superfamily protein
MIGLPKALCRKRFMPAMIFRLDDFTARLGPAQPVAVPLGDPVAAVRTCSIVNPDPALNSKIGVWECSPGRWVRQVVQAEYCHFLSGSATFTPDDGGAPMTTGAGDVVYFPERSGGVWDIHVTSRKLYIVFDERPVS